VRVEIVVVENIQKNRLLKPAEPISKQGFSALKTGSALNALPPSSVARRRYRKPYKHLILTRSSNEEQTAEFQEKGAREMAHY